MAEKKAPSGGKDATESPGKKPDPEDLVKNAPADTPKPADKAKTPVEDRGSASKPATTGPADKKTSGSASSPTSPPPAAKPLTPKGPDTVPGAPGNKLAGNKPSDTKPFGDKSAKGDNPSIDTAAKAPPTSDISRSSVPASGAKPAASTAPDVKSGSAGSVDVKTPPKPSSAKGPESGATVQKPSAPFTGTKPPAQTRPQPAGSGTQGPASRDGVTSSRPKRGTGGFLALLLGGVCAGAIGFAAAYYLEMQNSSAAARNTAATLGAQSDKIDALEARLDSLPSAPDTSGVEAAQEDTAAKLTELSDKISALTAQVDEIEAQPTGGGEGGVSASDLKDLRGTLKDLRGTLDDQSKQIANLVSEAEERDNDALAAAQQDLRRAALSRIGAALDSGTPFAPALDDLEKAGISAPDALQNAAGAGVPTQAALQQAFAPAARTALAQARRSRDGGGTDSVWSFLSGQLGARSLERREGPGTDAILSRAEDDLRNGDLAAALTEVETLPEPASGALAEWTQDAKRRMQALAAYDALAAKMN
ncbi:MAG: hypothetical protein Q4P24_02405 [Rhodobacterales bacterium]|nr:hypothetical protein [Rhodobacterales bacterium]